MRTLRFRMVFEILPTHARVIRGLIEEADLQELSTEPPIFGAGRRNYDFSSFAMETFRNCQEQNREKAQHVYPWDGRDLPGGSLHRNPLASNAGQGGRSRAFTYHTRASETFGADARSKPGRRGDCYRHPGWKRIRCKYSSAASRFTELNCKIATFPVIP